MIFHMRSFKENFLDKISSAICMNYVSMNGPDLIQKDFDQNWIEICQIYKSFSHDKRKEYEEISIEHDTKVKELEDLFLGKDIANIDSKANASDVESAKEKLNHKPFNLSISEGQMSVVLGSFSAKINFGVFIHFFQKMQELKTIHEKKEKLESIFTKLDRQESIIYLYERVMKIRYDQNTIAFLIKKIQDGKDIEVRPICIPRIC